jgi:hypothetical protein
MREDRDEETINAKLKLFSSMFSSLLIKLLIIVNKIII